LRKLKITVFLLIFLLLISSGIIGLILYKQKNIQTLYLFLEDTENIEDVSTNISDYFVYSQNVFPGILDVGYPTELRIKLSDMMLNHQKKYTKEKLLAIFDSIGVEQKDLDKNISDYQSIIDFRLSVMVAIRDRKNDEVINLLKRYYQKDSGLITHDNLTKIILLTKQKLSSTIGVDWISWHSLK